MAMVQGEYRPTYRCCKVRRAQPRAPVADVSVLDRALAASS